MDKDASQMTDEELAQAIEGNPPLEESPSEDTAEPEVSEEAEVVEEIVESPEKEEPVEEVAKEDPPVSRRENLRIQQLLEKIKQQPAQVEAPQATGLDYNSALDADPEVIRQLEADRQASSQTAYSQGLEQAKSIQFHTRLELDAPKVESKYAVLNPNDKENFNPAVADAINTQYLHLVGFNQATGQVVNPDIRYADYVEAAMELSDAIGSKKVIETAKNVAKQAKSTGLRPDGSTAKRLDLTKAPDQMSDEELKAFLTKAGVPN
jgi:hypothetical protein